MKKNAIVYGPPPRRDEEDRLDKLKKDEDPKDLDDSKFNNIVYGPPPRRGSPKREINEEEELMKRMSNLKESKQK